MTKGNYPHLLLQEDKFAKRSLELLGKANKDGTITTQVTATLRPAPDRNAGVQLYDLVRADTHRHAQLNVGCQLPPCCLRPVPDSNIGVQL